MYLLKKNFEEAKAEDLEELRRYFQAYDYKSSGHTFTSMFMWGPEYDVSWEIIEGYLWTASSYFNEFSERDYYTTMPLSIDGYEEERLAASIRVMKEKFEAKGKKLVMYQVPNHMVKFIKNAWDGEMEVTSDRDSFDYVYKREKLIKLSGRALHKKKNHLNYFLKNYDFESSPLEEGDIEKAIAFAKSFNEEKETDTKKDAAVLEKETKAIERALKYKGQYITRVIRIDGKIEALAIGAQVNEREAVEHIEKANPDIRGLFQLINQEFAKGLPEKVQLVNREEDMGIPNLRQAKEGYQPLMMYEKSTIVLK